MWKWVCCALACASWLQAELPAFYKQVDRVVWVVPDVDQAIAVWKPTGMVEVLATGDASFPAEYRGKQGTSTVRFAALRFGDVIVNWMQPVTGENAFSEFLKNHPAGGVLGLMHGVSAAEDLDSETTRMAALGVGVLQRGPIGSDGSRYVMFDTVERGKYCVGVLYMPGGPPPAAPQTARKVTQFAFMVREHEPVSRYWAKLGWPEMSVTEGPLTDMTYRGKPAGFAARLGWQRHGKVVYEWILPVKGPSAWHDHLNAHGEGFHHFGTNVVDMDAAKGEWEKAGFSNLQAGGWGAKGEKGSGRFTYMGARGAAGADIELLWNSR